MMTEETGKQDFGEEGQVKLLSMVVIGRNDDYMGNFKYRLTTCLNYLARNLRDIGRLDDVEIVVTDWNSDIPLTRVLRLSPEAGQVCRFVYVPPKLADALQQPGEVFHPTYALNTALRRGRGRFLMLFDADSLMPRHSLQSLLDLLDGRIPVPYSPDRVFFFCGRYQVPWEIVRREPSLEEWDRYLTLNSGQWPLDAQPLGLGVGGAAQLMHRSIWYACRGYNQNLRTWGWSDGELALRVTQYYPWVDLASLGIALFHREHQPRPHRFHREQQPRPRRSVGEMAPHSVSYDFAVNDENWGLGNYELAIQTAENVSQPARDSELAGTGESLASWVETRGELLAELTGRPLRQHLQRTVCSQRVNPTEWGSLYALAWYSLYRYPRSYLEFGIRSGYAAATVAAACPGVEIYGLESWQASGCTRAAPPPPYTTGILQDVGYRGYMRLVSGDLRTAFSRLRDSAIGPLRLDLALVRGDLFGADAIQQLSDLVPHLAPGGAIVFTCSSKAIFEAVWDEFQAAFPQLTYWECKQRNTGLALAAALQDGRGKPSEAEEAALAAAWRGLRTYRPCWPLWRRRFRTVGEELQGRPVRGWPKTLWARWTAFRRRWWGG
jgi:predicted O-methyltransferase YrrM